MMDDNDTPTPWLIKKDVYEQMVDRKESSNPNPTAEFRQNDDRNDRNDRKSSPVESDPPVADGDDVEYF